jgi:hypothetical protein
MLVSTFEILLKSQLPSVPALAKLNRKVIQGYFLTIANVNIVPVLNSRLAEPCFPITLLIFWMQLTFPVLIYLDR